jgi:tyrosine-protein kinase Etk/Wzc
MNTDNKALNTQVVPLEPPPAPGRQGAAAPPVTAASSEELTLREFARTVADGRWVVLASMVVAVLGGLGYLAAARPVYHADTLLHVDPNRSGPSVMAKEFATVFGIPSGTDTETEFLRSRSLVAAVVKELRLDVQVVPRYFPVIGEPVARLLSTDEPAPPWLGLSTYAWGGERIEILKLEVPRELEGQELTLVAGDGGHYELLGPDGAMLGSGNEGDPLKVGETTLFVSQLRAREGTHFRLRKIPIAVAIEGLRARLAIGEKAHGTGLIEVGLDSDDAGQACAILDTLTRTYVRQNVERRSEEAEKTLEFINSQLPQLKANAENAEKALNAYRTNRRSGFDVNAETHATLDRTATIERMLTEIELQASELRQKYTDKHPTFQALENKAAQLRMERAALDRQMQRLPETEFNLVRLMRDAKVASEMYVLLLNRSQELSVVKSGTVATVRILDPALAAPTPVSPRRGATLVLAIGVGLVGGIVIVLGRKAFAEAVDDPDVIEAHTGVAVAATIPHSRIESAISGKGRKDLQASRLAATHPTDLAVEALRSLRTSVQFAVAGARTNIVAIMGPSPSVGKTFVSVNLAQVLADAGIRVLLVDADLRRGTVHQHLGAPPSPGLSEILQGTARLAEVRHCVSPRLDVVASGEPPINPSELLSSRRFDQLLEAASPEYDIVLVDTAPILAVTDGVVAGRRAATALLVLRAGQHRLGEITNALKQMVRNGVAPTAIILNDMRRRAAEYSTVAYGERYQATRRRGSEPPPPSPRS